MKWTANNISRQDGRSFLITGTGGLGFETALALCHAGADVILAGRNQQKGEDAVTKIRLVIPSAGIQFEQLDLASLASIEQFGQRLRGQRDSLDVLINNAGVMALPARQTTADGYEVQFATNFLGPFTLTAQLLPLLRRGRGARVVMVSSLVARNGRIDFGDLQSNNYKPIPAYAQSKLADLIFALEFQRRSEANGWGVSALAAHPGIASTELITNGPGRGSFFGFLAKTMPFLFQTPAQGVLPILFAASATDAAGGGYYGPDGMGGLRGYPARALIPAKALDPQTAARLWNEALNMTGVKF